jgi:ferritin-like metal-binding protein YciE
MATLHDLYVEQLRDLYNAEQQLIQALPKMASAASHRELQEAFEDHLEETHEQIQRLNSVFTELGTAATGETCEAMQGIIKEGEAAIRDHADPDVRDAALIAAAQRVEHYEMAGYGTVRSFARQLGFGSQADLLQRTLDEEGAADKRLTKIAEGGLLKTGINKEAESR